MWSRSSISSAPLTWRTIKRIGSMTRSVRAIHSSWCVPCRHSRQGWRMIMMVVSSLGWTHVAKLSYRDTVDLFVHSTRKAWCRWLTAWRIMEFGELSASPEKPNVFSPSFYTPKHEHRSVYPITLGHEDAVWPNLAKFDCQASSI